MQYVIVGAGPSGVTAAETLRARDPESKIILIDGENAAPYGRMAIPYLLTGQISEEGLSLRKTINHFSELNIDLLKGRVQKISPKGNLLTLDTGQQISFDKILLAAGSIPIKPPIPGLDGSNIHHCWTLKDAQNIINLVGPNVDVALLGAGFIGCIIMEALVFGGAKLTVIEAEERMVPRMMDEASSHLIKLWCIKQGVSVLTAARAISVKESSGRKIITLNNGKKIEADLVVVATGVKPNIDFLAGSGIEVDQGVIINNQLETSIDNIFAAGDIAQGLDFSTKSWSVHAVQPTGVEHGRLAALSMTGQKVNYRGSLNMNILDTLGLISCSFGLWDKAPGGECAVRLDENNFRYTKLNFLENRLVGALLVGRTENIGVIRGLIQTSVDLGHWKDRLIEDPNEIAQAYIECTTAYDHNNIYEKILKKSRGNPPVITPFVDKINSTEALEPNNKSINSNEVIDKKTTKDSQIIDEHQVSITITLKLYAMLAKYLPQSAVRNEAKLRIKEGIKVQNVLDEYNVPSEHCHLVLINGRYVTPSERTEINLSDGDVIAVWPPVAGG